MTVMEHSLVIGIVSPPGAIRFEEPHEQFIEVKVVVGSVSG
jgi:hypothetical protein